VANVQLDDDWPRARGTVELMLGRHNTLLDGNGNGSAGLVSVVARMQTEDTVVRDRHHRTNQRWLLLLAAIPIGIELLKLLGWLPK
jgi:hypothetical protein